MEDTKLRDGLQLSLRAMSDGHAQTQRALLPPSLLFCLPFIRSPSLPFCLPLSKEVGEEKGGVGGERMAARGGE